MPGSRGAGVEKPNQINVFLFFINFPVVIAVDVLTATSNEFQRVGPATENALEPRVVSGNITCFGII